MVSLRRFAARATTLLALLVLVPASIALHDHDAGSLAAGNADCDACQFPNISAVEAADSSSAPDLVADTIVPATAAGKRTTHIGIRPSRGPPA